MNNLGKRLFSILFIVPASAFAHGEDVLMTILIQSVSMIIFFIITIAVKLSLIHKLILIGLFFFSSIAVFLLTINLPYSENMNKINLLITFVPSIIYTIALIALKSKSKESIEEKQKNNFS